MACMSLFILFSLDSLWLILLLSETICVELEFEETGISIGLSVTAAEANSSSENMLGLYGSIPHALNPFRALLIVAALLKAPQTTGQHQHP